MKIVLSTLLVFFNLSVHAQNEDAKGYVKYIDSAYATYDKQAQLATSYLDSIPEPIDINIKGHIADYFKLRGLISDRLNNRAELFQNFLMALKYAKIEENYDIAGTASVELFYNTYFLSKSKDSTAIDYLKDAKVYFEKANNYNGLVEVEQMYAYVEMYKENYEKSNALLLQNLSKYKTIKDDGYYYLYALFMLSSNYIHQGDLNNSHKYFKQLKTLNKDTTISKYLLDLHKVSLNTCLAEYHHDLKSPDSTQYYLTKAKELKYAMSNSDTELYYKLYAKYYQEIGDLDNKSRYVDSLAIFEAKLLEKNMTASLKINDSLEQSESLIQKEADKKKFNRNLALILCSVLGVLGIAFIIKYKRYKKRTKEFINDANKSQHLKSNNEKLKVKVVGLEQYILKVKDDVKSISATTEPVELRKNIKELYKNIHLKSTTELTNGESHLGLINDLNVEFFNEIKNLYPQLNDSEIIICYYIFTGFKNKEIASFLNVSTRSVESKRYRISKKININSNQTTLAEHLQDVFKNFHS
ncbi:LuxR C-terminal-related transcriptional regulator [Psychroserpens sp. AS72]|uniref:helix-turn-helix transcriptional regulator n=1 Tax=Psychroserpens sp. AS72 TaxID=3135775 RepID=UPI0031760FEA